MMFAEKNTAEGHAVIHTQQIHFACEMCHCQAKAACLYSLRLATSGGSATSPLHYLLHKLTFAINLQQSSQQIFMYIIQATQADH